MYELAQARVELSLLEKQERELIKALCHVRHAAEEQRTKIKELVELLPSPIDRLPNELLLCIIDLAIPATIELDGFRDLSDSYDDGDDWKTKVLMKVSRHWRNTILHCPHFWSTIGIAPSWNKSKLKAYVERSSPSPVDVEIYGWDSWCTESNLNEVFDTAALCADRWHSVKFSKADHTRLILPRFRHLMLPSLARVSMEHISTVSDGDLDIFSLPLFTPGNSPFLEYLQVGEEFITAFGLPILSSLKELDIHLPRSTPPTFLEQLSSYPRLATLTLSGDVRTLELLRPYSIRLPFLDRLICKVFNATSLLHAIVAPRLRYFEYSPANKIYFVRNVFDELGSTFSGARHLVLRSTYLLPKDICSAFPDVRHVELLGHCADAIFQNNLSSSTWQHLECLSIDSGVENHEAYEEVHIDHDTPQFLEGLENWLQLRQNTGQSMLRIKISSYRADATWISKMHDALHGLCILEWVDNAFTVSVGLSGTSTAPWLVSKFLHISLLKRYNTMLLGHGIFIFRLLSQSQ